MRQTPIRVSACVCEGFSYITSREGFVSKVDRYVTNTVQLVRKKKGVEMKRVNPIPYYSNIGIEKEQKRQEIEIKK